MSSGLSETACRSSSKRLSEVTIVEEYSVRLYGCRRNGCWNAWPGSRETAGPYACVLVCGVHPLRCALMRVVAGRVGGRKLRGPSTETVRPTTDKVRGAIFNALASMVDVEDMAVLDLFAGTGACGIEALSRGAKSATFVDRDRRSLAVVVANLESLGLDGEVVCSDALAFLDRHRGFDMIIADPPYELDVWGPIQRKVQSDLLVCESAEPIVVEPGWRSARERRYGDTMVTILRRDR